MIERIKNLTIMVLVMSLIGLSLLNWFYWSDISFTAPFEVKEEFKQDDILIDIARPVSGDYERYRAHIVEFLGAANKSAVITRRTWDATLEDGGIHFDFLCPVPVWLMAEGYSASSIFDGVMANEVILSEEGLLIYDGKSYIRFSAPLPFRLPEQVEEEPAGEDAYPLAVMSDRFLEEPHLSELLESLGFNPNTNFRYTQSDGDMVVVDDARTLHISPNGRVVYHDGTQYTETETINGRDAVKLCQSALPQGSAFWGDGQLVFNSMTEQGNEFNIVLTYILDGAVFLDWQTVFVVNEGVLREAVIYLAPASFTDESFRLMPRNRAAVLIPDGKRMCVGYSTADDGLWKPDWYGY